MQLSADHFTYLWSSISPGGLVFDKISMDSEDLLGVCKLAPLELDNLDFLTQSSSAYCVLLNVCETVFKSKGN